MRIEEFCIQHGGNVRSIRDVARQWQCDELDSHLLTLHHQHEQLIGSAVVAGDAVYGGTLLDQIPPEVRDAFSNLFREKASTYREMRQILLSRLTSDEGGFLSFEDRHVIGFISKLKGQIGENLFQQHVGTAATLATSGSQEGWDVAIRQSDGLHEYVQVKLYDEPYGVVRHMLKVQEKIACGKLVGIDQEPIRHVYFAVPDNIRYDVERLAETHDGLSDMLYEKSIPISSRGAADLVTEGMSNVGPDELGHFFDELFGGAIAASSLHGIVNGFLWYKGSKEFSAAFADTVANTAISSTGIGLGLVAETLCHTAMLSGAVGISGRIFLGRLARSRWDFAEFLSTSIAEVQACTAALQKRDFN